MEKQRVILNENSQAEVRIYISMTQSSQKNTEVVLVNVKISVPAASCASLLKNSLSCLAKLGQFSQKGKQEPPKRAKFVELFKEAFSFYRILGRSRYM